jgi:hypothetical protein
VFETDLALPAIDVLASWHPRLSGDDQHKWLREFLMKGAKGC